MDDAEEKTLIELAGRGDREASAELIRRYRERIYRTIQPSGMSPIFGKR